MGGITNLTHFSLQLFQPRLDARAGHCGCWAGTSPRTDTGVNIVPCPRGDERRESLSFAKINLKGTPASKSINRKLVLKALSSCPGTRRAFTPSSGECWSGVHPPNPQILTSLVCRVGVWVLDLLHTPLWGQGHRRPPGAGARGASAPSPSPYVVVPRISHQFQPLHRAKCPDHSPAGPSPPLWWAAPCLAQPSFLFPKCPFLAGRCLNAQL